MCKTNNKAFPNHGSQLFLDGCDFLRMTVKCFPHFLDFCILRKQNYSFGILIIQNMLAHLMFVLWWSTICNDFLNWEVAALIPADGSSFSIQGISLSNCLLLTGEVDLYVTVPFHPLWLLSHFYST